MADGVELLVFENGFVDGDAHISLIDRSLAGDYSPVPFIWSGDLFLSGLHSCKAERF